MGTPERRRRKRIKTLVHAEDIEATTAELISQVLTLAKPRHAENEEVRARFPDISESLERGIRGLLEDEITPAVQSPDGSNIRESELQRELIKKALVGLKVPVLRDIARDRGLSPSGSAEDVVSRVAASYDWNEDEIAQLILDNAPEPLTRVETGHSTRVLNFAEKPAVGHIAERLSYATGRYIRTGIAKWFVFEAVNATPGEVVMSGSYRTYSARVDEDALGTPGLSATPSQDATTLRIQDRTTFVVDDASLTTSRAAVSALHTATGQISLDYLPAADIKAAGLPNRVHPSSTFLLDLLYNRFPAARFTDTNLSLARFRVSDPRDDDEGLDASRLTRPLLRAVRFEGQHLLDSIPACQLITEDGRPLTEFVATVAVRHTETNIIRGRFPVRISLDTDHVHVSTGFGTGEHTLSVEVHNQVVAAVRDAFESGVMNTERLDLLTDRMRKRASMSETPDQADMLS